MNKGILITLPRHDDVTEYLSAFSKEIEQEATERGIKIKKLKDEEATKDAFEKAIEKLDYSMLIFNGHGTENSIKGYSKYKASSITNSLEHLTTHYKDISLDVSMFVCASE